MSAKEVTLANNVVLYLQYLAIVKSNEWFQCPHLYSAVNNPPKTKNKKRQ